jgi:hypothetical protein
MVERGGREYLSRESSRERKEGSSPTDENFRHGIDRLPILDAIEVLDSLNLSTFSILKLELP